MTEWIYPYGVRMIQRENQSMWYITLTEYRGKKHMIISIVAEKAFDEILHSHDKHSIN